MQAFEYHSPTKIVFGSGTEQRAGELAKECGAGRVLLLYGGASAQKSGLIGRLEDSLRAAGIAVQSSGGVVPNPLLSTVRRMIEEAIAFRADFILAAGGGSVIDTAKAVALGAANPQQDVWDFWLGKAAPDACLPIGSVLTISAAGSEVSEVSVLTNDAVSPPDKRGFHHDMLRGQFTILDPTLTMSLPVWQVGAGAADIFLHTSERYFAPVQGNHLTDEIALVLMRTIIRFGPRAVQNRMTRRP